MALPDNHPNDPTIWLKSANWPSSPDAGANEHGANPQKTFAEIGTVENQQSRGLRSRRTAKSSRSKTKSHRTDFSQTATLDSVL